MVSEVTSSILIKPWEQMLSKYTNQVYIWIEKWILLIPLRLEIHQKQCLYGSCSGLSRLDSTCIEQCLLFSWTVRIIRQIIIICLHIVLMDINNSQMASHFSLYPTRRKKWHGLPFRGTGFLLLAHLLYSFVKICGHSNSVIFLFSSLHLYFPFPTQVFVLFSYPFKPYTVSPAPHTFLFLPL